jgi:predicted Rdx family selenoprotein
MPETERPVAAALVRSRSIGNACATTAQYHGVDIQPGGTGQFNIVVDSELAYSRNDTGRFPSEAELTELTG